MTALGGGVYVIGNMQVRFNGDKWAAQASDVRLGLFDSKELAWRRLQEWMDAERERKPS